MLPRRMLQPLWREMDTLERAFFDPFFPRFARFQPLAVAKDESMSFSKDKFAVKLNVADFRPEDIKLSLHGNELRIEGKHEEKSDNHGYISRQFVRRFVLPSTVDNETISSKLDSEGVLFIEAANKEIEGPPKNIPIEHIKKPEKEKIEGDKE